MPVSGRSKIYLFLFQNWIGDESGASSLFLFKAMSLMWMAWCTLASVMPTVTDFFTKIKKKYPPKDLLSQPNEIFWRDRWIGLTFYHDKWRKSDKWVCFAFKHANLRKSTAAEGLPVLADKCSQTKWMIHHKCQRIVL